MTDHARIREAVETHRAMLAAFESHGIGTVVAMAQAIVQSLQNNGTLYLCGNGGSAADAQHIAGEFVGRFRIERRPLPAVALSTDTSVLTCIGNDYDYQSVFSRQVEALVRPGDILWAFSTSGTSPNVLKAAEAAKRKEAPRPGLHRPDQQQTPGYGRLVPVRRGGRDGPQPGDPPTGVPYHLRSGGTELREMIQLRVGS